MIKSTKGVLVHVTLNCYMFQWIPIFMSNIKQFEYNTVDKSGRIYKKIYFEKIGHFTLLLIILKRTAIWKKKTVIWSFQHSSSIDKNPFEFEIDLISFVTNHYHLQWINYAWINIWTQIFMVWILHLDSRALDSKTIYLVFVQFNSSLPLTINMAASDKIKLFKFIQKTYQDIGVYPPQSNQNCSSINAKKWLFSFILLQFFVSTTAYLLIEANSMTEYGMGFYTSVTIAIFSFFWQMKNTYSYIEHFERFIERSEY